MIRIGLTGPDRNGNLPATNQEPKGNDPMTSKLSRLLVLCIGLAAMGTLQACNTVEGAGRDVQAVGKGVSKGASKVKSKM